MKISNLLTSDICPVTHDQEVVYFMEELLNNNTKNVVNNNNFKPINVMNVNQPPRFAVQQHNMISIPMPISKKRSINSPSEMGTNKKVKSSSNESPNIKKGEWGTDEKERFMTLLETKKKGESWKEFSLKIPFRTGSQCCDLFRKRLIPNGEVISMENKIILSHKGIAELHNLRKQLVDTSSKCQSCFRWFPKSFHFKGGSSPKDFSCYSCENGKTPKSLIVSKENLSNY
eukprot:TRINITY_DN14307_c0_g1_i1.p1 TRINITY_DN14307_c0_g1~~TRINITY_DN14307_c0_g1_i1.p1  ORF type:complete len:230 (+),score=63.51 TRINITY_DN14307_c0_g1_i1:62-751(+)